MSIQEETYRIKQFKNGDKEAFSMLFQQYSKKVYYFALGYLKTKSEAQDTVQEVFYQTLGEKSIIRGGQIYFRLYFYTYLSPYH